MIRLLLRSGSAAAAGVAKNAETRHAAYKTTKVRAAVSRSFLSRVLREPIVHFMALGGMLFLLTHVLGQQRPFSRITITKDQVNRMADNYRLQYGSLPSSSQLEVLVEKYIDEEVFYREALKLGLQQNDEIVRRRLVQKYEFLQQDLSTPADPTNSQLEDYYRQHLNLYRVPERVTFTQVYVSPDHRGERAARTEAVALALRLNRRGSTRGVEQGDRFPGPQDFTALTQEELVRVFGEEGLAQDIFRVALKRWSAPMRSGYGWHTVYVSATEAARQATFLEVRDQVRRDWVESVRAQHNALALSSLRAQFTIERQ